MINQCGVMQHKINPTVIHNNVIIIIMNHNYNLYHAILLMVAEGGRLHPEKIARQPCMLMFTSMVNLQKQSI